MKLEQHPNKDIFKNQSIVYVDDPNQMISSAVVFGLFVFLGVPFMISQSTFETYFVAKILCYAFLEALCLYAVYSILRAGSFHFSANKLGWYFRPKSRDREQLVFVPWSDCMAISSESMSDHSESLRLDVVKDAHKPIYEPLNGQMEIQKDKLIYLMNNPSKKIKVSEFVNTFSQLKSESVPSK